MAQLWILDFFLKIGDAVGIDKVVEVLLKTCIDDVGQQGVVGMQIF